MGFVAQATINEGLGIAMIVKEKYQVIHIYKTDCDSTNWRWLDCDDCADVHEVCQMRVCVDCGGDVETVGETR